MSLAIAVTPNQNTSRHRFPEFSGLSGTRPPTPPLWGDISSPFETCHRHWPVISLFLHGSPHVNGLFRVPESHT